MASVNRKSLPHRDADLIDRLHTSITADSTFAGIAIDYDQSTEATPWYAAMISDIALLVGDESLEYISGVASLEGSGPNFLYKVTVLTTNLVITCAGGIAVGTPFRDHGPVEAVSRSTLEGIEVVTTRADPFSEHEWPGRVVVLGKYTGRSPGVSFTVRGDEVEPLLNALRADLTRGR